MSERTREPATARSILSAWGPLAVLLVIMSSIYSTTWTYSYSWDDELFLNKSPKIGDTTNIKKAFSVDYWGLVDNPSNPQGSPLYRPLALSHLILERALFGSEPHLFRAVHSMWHLLNIVLVFIFARAFQKGSSPHGPIFAATAFAVFPYTVDTVLFLTSIGDLMALSFLLLTALSFLKWLSCAGIHFAVGTALASLLAMFSKESAVSIPLVLAAVYLHRGTPALRKRAIFAIATSTIAVITFLLLRATVVASIAPSSILELIKWLPVDLAVALRWTIVPFPLVLEQKVLHELGNLHWVLGLLGIIAVVFLGIRYRRRYSHVVAGVAIWIVSVIPSLVALQWTQAFAPRYLYLPALGIALIVGYLAADKRLPSKILLGVVLLGMGLATVSRTVDWNDRADLWSVEVSRQPNSRAALTNLGNILADRGEYKQALALQIRAAQVAEKQNGRCEAAFAYANAATILSSYLNNIEAAKNLYEKCIALCPHKARNAWMGLARIYARGAQWSQAVQAVENALKVGPRDPPVLMLRADLFAAQGRLEQALADLFEVRGLVLPNSPQAAYVDQKIAALRNSEALRPRVEDTNSLVSP